MNNGKINILFLCDRKDSLESVLYTYCSGIMDKKTKSASQNCKRKCSMLFMMVLISLFVASGCATHHKYKKIKAVPCPCEKENRR